MTLDADLVDSCKPGDDVKITYVRSELTAELSK